MTLYDAISRAIQALAIMAVGLLFGAALLIGIGATLADMVATGLFTIEQAADGIPWEGQP